MPTHIGKRQLLGIIDIGDGGLALADEVVLVDIVTEQAILCTGGHSGHRRVQNVFRGRH